MAARVDSLLFSGGEGGRDPPRDGCDNRPRVHGGKGGKGGNYDTRPYLGGDAPPTPASTPPASKPGGPDRSKPGTPAATVRTLASGNRVALDLSSASRPLGNLTQGAPKRKGSAKSTLPVVDPTDERNGKRPRQPGVVPPSGVVAPAAGAGGSTRPGARGAASSSHRGGGGSSPPSTLSSSISSSSYHSSFDFSHSSAGLSAGGAAWDDHELEAFLEDVDTDPGFVGSMAGYVAPSVGMGGNFGSGGGSGGGGGSNGFGSALSTGFSFAAGASNNGGGSSGGFGAGTPAASGFGASGGGFGATTATPGGGGFSFGAAGGNGGAGAATAGGGGYSFGAAGVAVPDSAIPEPLIGHRPASEGALPLDVFAARIAKAAALAATLAGATVATGFADAIGESSESMVQLEAKRHARAQELIALELAVRTATGNAKAAREELDAAEALVRAEVICMDGLQKGCRSWERRGRLFVADILEVAPPTDRPLMPIKLGKVLINNYFPLDVHRVASGLGEQK